MKSRTSLLFLAVLFSLSLVHAARGEGDGSVVWKIEKPGGVSLEVKRDSYSGWSVAKGKKTLYLVFSNGGHTLSGFYNTVGGFFGVLLEGLGLHAHTVGTVTPLGGGPRIKFLESGSVELQFFHDDGSKRKPIEEYGSIVLSRKEALDLTHAVQRHFQNQLADQDEEQTPKDAESSKQPAEQPAPSDGDKPSN